MRIALCDDEPGDRSLLAGLARQVTAQEEITCELVQYDSSTALLRAIEAGAAYDTLLLDVVMPDMDGMQLAAALRKQKNNTSIVFVSSNREMALMGYEVAAVRFLSKSAQEDKLREALLPPGQFVLCHRTVLANLAYVQYLRYCELEMKTGAILPVSKYRQSAIRDKLMNYLSE